MSPENADAWLAVMLRFADRTWAISGIGGFMHGPVMLLHRSAAQDAIDSQIMLSLTHGRRML